MMQVKCSLGILPEKRLFIYLSHKHTQIYKHQKEPVFFTHQLHTMVFVEVSITP